MWEAQKKLASDWTLLLMERRGFGSSPPAEREDFEVDAQDIAAALGEGAHLVAHSYGAIGALLAASWRPEAVRSLKLIEPVAFTVAIRRPAVQRALVELIEHYTIGPSEPRQFLEGFMRPIGIRIPLPPRLPPPMEHTTRLLMRAPAVRRQDKAGRAQNADWMARMQQPGIRSYSTVHLLGEGYWVWLIPLVSDAHSIGIVADPRFHPFERIATFDAAVEWLRLHEPQLAATIERRRSDVMDFLTIENFAHGCGRVFSPERWAITGDAGWFMDPLLSPGSDYIAIANTYACDLIKRDLDGEDIKGRAEIYNGSFNGRVDTSLNGVYVGQYAVYGDAEVYAAKLAHDYTIYWGMIAPLHYYDKFCDLEFIQAVWPDVQRSIDLTPVIQQLFRDWHALGQRQPNPTGLMLETSAFQAMWDRDRELTGLDDATLRERLRSNAGLLEALAVVFFHKACRRLSHEPPDPERRINPYAVTLDPQRWESDGLLDEDGLTLAEAYDRLPGLHNVMLDELAVQYAAGGTS